MNKKELMDRRAKLLAEVEGADEKRFAEIKTEIEKVDFQLAGLKAQEDADAAQRAKEQQEADERAARKPAQGKTVLFDSAATENSAMTKAEELRTAKTAFGKQVRAALNNLPVNLTANEKRALGVAVTTTSETYTEPTADANGVNNGGIFIPQTVLYDLLELDEADSPFLRDVAPKYIKGLTFYPYVEEATNDTTGGNVARAELAKSGDRSIKWSKLSLAQGNYPLTIQVTLELLAMTDEEFADYLLADLGNEINILLTDEVLYGTGKDDRIEGATVGAIQGTYTSGKESDAIRTGLLALSRRARRGAKVYISREFSLTLAFEKDSTGQYIFPIYNNDGITSIATVPVEVDETLVDGDFIIGNPKNYILNFVKPTEIYTELHGRDRVIEYTAHLMVAGKAAPKKFYYGTLAEAEATADDTDAS